MELEYWSYLMFLYLIAGEIAPTEFSRDFKITDLTGI